MLGANGGVQMEETQHTFEANPKQEMILSYLLANDSAWAVCSSIIEDDFFDKELQPVVKCIRKMVDEYRSVPTAKIVESETGIRLHEPDDGDDPRRFRWVCDQVEKFCRTQAVIRAVYDASEKIMKDELEGIVDPIKQACLLSLNKELGTNYWSDPETRLKRMLSNSSFPIGFRDMDELLYGGVEPGNLTMFSAGCVDPKTNVTVILKRIPADRVGFSIEVV